MEKIDNIDGQVWRMDRSTVLDIDMSGLTDRQIDRKIDRQIDRQVWKVV